jgi:hypothetical protein
VVESLSKREALSSSPAPPTLKKDGFLKNIYLMIWKISIINLSGYIYIKSNHFNLEEFKSVSFCKPGHSYTWLSLKTEFTDLFVFFFNLPKYSTINMSFKNTQFFPLTSSNFCTTRMWLSGLKYVSHFSTTVLDPVFWPVERLPATKMRNCVDFLLNQKEMFSKDP